MDLLNVGRVVWVCYVSKSTRGERAEPRFNTSPPGAVLTTAANLDQIIHPSTLGVANPLLDGVFKHLSCHHNIIQAMLSA